MSSFREEHLYCKRKSRQQQQLSVTKPNDEPAGDLCHKSVRSDTPE